MIQRLLFIFALLLVFTSPSKAQNPTPFNEPPAWSKSVIWYQIFVERFNNGDKTNDPTPLNMKSASSDPTPQGWTVTPWTWDWYKQEEWAQKTGKSFENMLQHRRYGGDLQGVLNKLDYLSGLGITAIYVNPINDAPSLHKYDARSYHHVDVNFGPDPVGDNNLIAQENPGNPSTWKWTSADKLFLKLVKEVHKRGMKIILDYSWNHTGVEFWAFRDVVEKQAQSKYKDWYDIKSFDNPNTAENEFKYIGWLNIQSLPEIKKVNITTTRVAGLPYEGNLNEGAKQHIFAVTKRWLAPDGITKDGIDGYRLDVADQIPMGFWRDYRKFVKSINPEAYLVGEIWWEKYPDKLMNPVPYESGDVFDAVMFYQAYRPARSFFAKTNFAIDAKQFKDSLEFQWNRLKPAYRYAEMNVNATHDAPRLLSCFENPGKYKYQAKPNDDPKYVSGKPGAETYKRVRLYLVHQFTSIGSPNIWNGDEMGMWGSDDPDCRKPLWWKEITFNPETRTNYQNVPKTYDKVAFNQQHFDFYKKLIAIRNSNLVLVEGKLDFIRAEGKMLAYKRYDKNQEIIVLFNLDTTNKKFDLPANTTYTNLLDNVVMKGNSISLKPLTAAILKKKSK
jgi:cyclomaltodextrinase